MTEKEYEEALNTSDKERDFKPSKSVAFIVIVCSLIALVAAIWILTYMLTSINLENSIDNMKPIVELDTETNQVVNVEVLSGEEFINIDDLVDYCDIPTIVDVKVYYEDGTIVEKQAYVSYNTDTLEKEVLYSEDEAYGHITLPNQG